MTWQTNLSQIFQDWAIVIIAAGIVLVYYGAKKISEKIKEIRARRLNAKMVQKKPVIQNPIQEIQEVKIETPKEETVFNFEETEYKKEPDLFKDLTKSIETIQKDSIVIEKKNVNDFEKMRLELIDLHQKRELIKEYGILLGSLYKKYGVREKYITAMMMSIEPRVQQPVTPIKQKV